MDSSDRALARRLAPVAGVLLPAALGETLAWGPACRGFDLCSGRDYPRDGPVSRSYTWPGTFDRYEDSSAKWIGAACLGLALGFITSLMISPPKKLPRIARSWVALAALTVTSVWCFFEERKYPTESAFPLLWPFFTLALAVFALLGVVASGQETP